MYSYGEGVPVDYAIAAKWYRKAAEQSYGVAQYNLGVLYAEGKGVPQDNDEAVKWLTLAANGGHFRARSMLRQLDPVAHADLPPEPPVSLGAPPSDDATSGGGTAATTAGGSALPPPSMTASTTEPRSVVMTTPKKTTAQPATTTPPIKVATSSSPPAATKKSDTRINGASSEKMSKHTVNGKGRIYRVQLGSSPREDLINKDWNSYQSRYPDLFSNLEGRVERAEVGAEKAIWYRLRVGPFASAASARELCEQLQQRGAKTGCMPLRASR
jgi:cell division septation protein DedD